VVEIANGIIAARGYRNAAFPRNTLLSDEAFDVDAFKNLKSLIVPSLGASVIPDSIRREFACSLLHSSFIYHPQRHDLPTKYREDGTLEGIYTVRPGRTFDPPPTSRSRMAYAALDTLFELSSSPDKDSSTNEESLKSILIARSISPYLILRCAVSLKSYIADQPLRGLMPQPTPARKALLHLLHEMVNLQSEPSAVPPPPMTSAVSGLDQSYKKHLEWIYPLVVQAVQVAGKERDGGEVLRALGEVLSRVSSNV
jgi:hypothetical protein